MRKQHRINIWRTFSENARKFADKECIWYSDPSTSPPTIYSYSWRDAHGWACRYAAWFLDAGVKPGDCVGFYLQNSPDFMFAWMGLLAVGCYPAMINYNLVGGALVHCAKIADCGLLLVDPEFRERVVSNEELRGLGVRLQVVDGEFRRELLRVEPRMPDEKYTENADEKTRYALRYTR